MKKQKYQKVERFGFLGLRRRHYLFVIGDNEVIDGVEVTLPMNTYFNEYYFAFLKGTGGTVQHCKIDTGDQRGLFDIVRPWAC